MVRVVDASQRNSLPTGHVAVENVTDETDREIAEVAGFCTRHWGFAVDRYDGGTATVHLWND